MHKIIISVFLFNTCYDSRAVTHLWLDVDLCAVFNQQVDDVQLARQRRNVKRRVTFLPAKNTANTIMTPYAVFTTTSHLRFDNSIAYCTACNMTAVATMADNSLFQWLKWGGLGGGGSAHLLRFEPPAIVWAPPPMIESIKCYFIPK